MTDVLRCVGCGKPIEPGTPTVRVAVGKTNSEHGFEEKKEFGRLHQPCFEHSVDSPQLALAEIRRLGKKTTVVSERKRRA